MKCGEGRRPRPQTPRPAPQLFPPCPLKKKKHEQPLLHQTSVPVSFKEPSSAIAATAAEDDY